MHDVLETVLEESKRFGFLGPGPVADHIKHASQFVAPLDTPLDQAAVAQRVGRFVDLGAGGGLPSLPMLVARPQWSAVLLDAIQKRCSFLVWAVAELGMSDRVEVWCGRAEEIGHGERAREQFDAVVARGFGPPPSTVECAAPLLRPGGRLVISEPPEGRTWPVDGLATVGMSELLPADEDAEAWPGVVVFTRTGDVPSTYPRRAKAQQRSPLF